MKQHPTLTLEEASDKFWNQYKPLYPEMLTMGIVKNVGLNGLIFVYTETKKIKDLPTTFECYNVVQKRLGKIRALAV